MTAPVMIVVDGVRYRPEHAPKGAAQGEAGAAPRKARKAAANKARKPAENKAESDEGTPSDA